MKFFLLLICFFLTHIACSCPSSKTTKLSGWAMTMPYKVIVGEKLSLEGIEKVEKIITATFSEVDAVYNSWNPSSEISLLNQIHTTLSLPISPAMHRLLLLSDSFYNLTEGRFDPTVGGVIDLWKKALASNTLPSIESSLKKVGWSEISFSENSLEKGDEDISFDFCAVAKGLCVDMLYERLIKEGFNHFFIEWAGEIRVSGSHPDKRSWKVQIAHCLEKSLSPSIIEIKQGAIATSGDVMSWSFSENGEPSTHFFHIVDPKTHLLMKKTNTSIVSATVTAPTCALADALATAAMTFSTKEEAEKWAETITEKCPGVTFWITAREPLTK